MIEYVTAPLRCTRLYPDAALPIVAQAPHAYVFAYLKSEGGHRIKLALPTNTPRAVRTGISVQVYDDYTIMLSTPLTLAQRGVSVVNTFPGGASSELIVWLHNTGTQTEWIEHGDCVAQVTLAQFPTILVNEETTREHPP
jgi:dUTPase